MKRFLCFLPIFLLVSLAYAEDVKPLAHADIMNASGEKVGTVIFYPKEGDLHMDLNITNLPLSPGEHGLHIHEVGKCDAPDFKSALAHFNPAGKKHGLEAVEGHHAGDLPNILLGEDGKADMKIFNRTVTLDEGLDSLFHEGGTSIVIDEKADDYKTDPDGNSGKHVACGVIEKS